MNKLPQSLDINTLHEAYRAGTFTPEALIDALLSAQAEYTDHNIWIRPLTKTEIQPYLDKLNNKDIKDLPLFGIPFAIKDNIDLANIPTTAACPEFAYTPTESAHIVAQLIDAGAIPMGKTNLDQFATGLVGTRSPAPWGPCKNAINDDYISGGSSAGSAVSVSLGLVTFSLGTDTAGSGRVPAMLNNIFGHKPSRGLFSMTGVVPACRSLDCPSVFAVSASDAQKIFNVAASFDDKDAYSRPNPYSNSHRYWGNPRNKPVIAVPETKNLAFFGNDSASELFQQSVAQWQALGAEIVTVDIQPLLEAAKLLYAGPWVAERYAAIEDLMQTNPEVIHPVVHEIIRQAESKTAVETFQFEYKMQGFRALAKKMFADFDFLITPTAPTAYKIDDVLANPIELNSNMGYYTNYMNLLDLCGTSVPQGIMENGLPFGITLIAPAMKDQMLLSFAHLWQQEQGFTVGAKQAQPLLTQAVDVKFQDLINIAVCGAHLTDMPLNWQLQERGATLSYATKTASNYRLFALAGGPPARPGLFRVGEGEGASIDVEVWSMPAAELGTFLANIPAPLGLGKLETQEGEWVTGFICEPYAQKGAEDITHYGSWKAYIADLSS